MHTSISTEIMATLPYVAKTPHTIVGNHYEPLKQMNYGKEYLGICYEQQG